MTGKEDNPQNPTSFSFESLPRRFLGDRIETELKKNPSIIVVGQFTLLQPGIEFQRFVSIRDFFVEPAAALIVEPPEDHEVVDLLNAAAWERAYLRPGLFKALEQFADAYNLILKTMFRPEIFADVSWAVTPFTPTVSFRETKVQFGSITFEEPYPVQAEFATPELQRQASLLATDLSQQEHTIPGIVRIRLFPQGLGDRVFRYEKGYYLDGNVAKWKDLVWGGRYISVNSVSPEQLRVIAEGQFPYPEVEYLPFSIYDGKDPEEARAIRNDRLFDRSSSQNFQNFASGIDNMHRPPTMQ
ncbi:MAG: hypothetical protein PHE48_00590 [Candidatus Daviesbacteria bacterium]|nr:hypothetical protein [Candidatus Daviesbacteria bacterium]